MNVRELLQADRFSVVRCCLAAINLTVGILFLVRSPLRKPGTLGTGLFVALSFVAGGLAFRLAPLPLDWPVYSLVLFALGTGLAVIALLTLGRSFAVLPALRRVIRHGPYRFIRHPIYLGELLMIAGCCLSSPQIELAGLALLALAGVVLRIRAEEATLLHDPDYEAYNRNTPWRLLPGIW